MFCNADGFFLTGLNETAEDERRRQRENEEFLLLQLDSPRRAPAMPPGFMEVDLPEGWQRKLVLRKPGGRAVMMWKFIRFDH